MRFFPCHIDAFFPEVGIEDASHLWRLMPQHRRRREPRRLSQRPKA